MAQYVAVALVEGLCVSGKAEGVVGRRLNGSRKAKEREAHGSSCVRAGESC